MLQNIPWNSLLVSTSFEILLMLSGSFLLWFILAWILKPDKSYVVLDAVSLDTYKKYLVCSKKSKEKKIPVVHNEQEQESQKPQKQDDIPWDDLTLIYWITPKISKILTNAEIDSYQAVVDIGVEWLEKILLEAGINSPNNSPATWPDQCRLAHKKHWRELEEYQAILQKKK